MERIEKVIKGLECHMSKKCETDSVKHEICPYWEYDNCVNIVMHDALVLLKEQEPIVHCKDCVYGLYTGTEYHCDKHSGHENRLGEDQYYKEWHNGNWFCADGERGVTQDE